MGRPSKLTPEQWAEVDRRLVAGEGVRALAREFGLDPSALSRRGVAQQSQQVRKAAEQMAAAQSAIAALPVPHQFRAMDLASKLRNISDNLASAAELGAKTSHRLQALANDAASKIDDAEPEKLVGHMKMVGAMTKLANDAAHIPLNLLAANKGAKEPEADIPKGLEHFYGGK